MGEAAHNLLGECLDMGDTLRSDTGKTGRAIYGGKKMARRGFQQGSLLQRGSRKKVWFFRWWEDVVEKDGAVRRVRRGETIGPVAQFPSRRAAMQAVSTRLAGINEGTPRAHSVRVFREFAVEDWSPVVLPTLKYATQKHYTYMLNVHLIPALGARQLREITREELQGFINRKLASGLSWKTVKHLRGGLTRVLGSAEEWGYIQHNPALKTRLPRRTYDVPRSALAPEQVRNLVAALDEPVRSLALLLALTGLRVGELLALRWGNVDVKAQALRVSETVYEGHFDKPKTKRSARIVPFGTQAAEIFAALRSRGAGPDALVFASKEGTPLDRRNLLKRYVKPAAKKIGLYANWHLLRHSYATMLDGVGTPLGTIQSLLGHSTPEITREIYLHAIPAEQRRAAESVERLVLGLNWTQAANGETSASERIN